VISFQFNLTLTVCLEAVRETENQIKTSQNESKKTIDNLKCPFFKDNIAKSLLVEKNLDDSANDLIDLTPYSKFFFNKI
jgi:hypothetical protein